LHRSEGKKTRWYGYPLSAAMVTLLAFGWLMHSAGKASGTAPVASANLQELDRTASEEPGALTDPGSPESPVDLSPAPAAASSSTSQTDEERPYTPPKPEEMARFAQERVELEQRWTSEARDSSWTSQAASRVADLLAARSLNTAALREVDCRQTICRFSLRAQSSLDREVSGLVFASRDLTEETWLMPKATDQYGWELEVFFPKEGFKLSGGGGPVPSGRVPIAAVPAQPADPTTTG